MKFLNCFLPIVVVLFTALGISAQSNDPVLFKVEDQEVRLSEFDYIYNKNNGDNANYQRPSLQEYLDLYIKFKLKVQKARDMQLDTITSLNRELEGYRKQLARSYLNDKEVTESLLREAFERKKIDRRVSHILISAGETASPERVALAKSKAKTLRKGITDKESFGKAALTRSEDKNSAVKNGDIGFLSAILPNGFYEFENAVYSMEIGEISQPIRSKVGFHIIMVTEERPARGEMEAAHILIRKKYRGVDNPNAKKLVDSLYAELQNGADFGQLARKYSQDSGSAKKDGYIGRFGINRYQKNFEKAAFEIENDGDYTTPIETEVGYHIIKRISKTDLNDYDTAKKRLQAQIAKDSRLNIAKQKMIESIKTEAQYEPKDENLDHFIANLSDDFYSFKWKVPNLENKEIFRLKGDNIFYINDFIAYCQKNSRKRMRFDKSGSLEVAVRSLYNDFVDEKCLKYEEENLERKYPEFRALMREYQEGILLFEATKMKVWDRASQDTAGLKAYYNDHREDFKWETRYKINEYTVHTIDEKKLKKIKKSASKHSDEKLMKKFNPAGDFIDVETNTVEANSKKLLGMRLKKGATSKVMTDEEKNQSYFNEIIEIIPSRLKTMAEAKGYIIADYQDYLEAEWIKSLREEYEVTINQDVFESIIKK